MNGYADPDPENLGDGAVYLTGSDPWIAEEERFADQRARQERMEGAGRQCFVCHFEIESPDDVAVAGTHPVCLRCTNRLGGNPPRFSKTLERELREAAGK